MMKGDRIELHQEMFTLFATQYVEILFRERRITARYMNTDIQVRDISLTLSYM